MYRCSKCGALIEPSTNFCKVCGSSVVMNGELTYNNIQNSNAVNQYNINTSNIPNNNLSVDEKLLASFVGNNYEKIVSRKFSISAFFFSFLYLLYRKVYIPTIIIMIATNFVSSFIENELIYNVIIYSMLFIFGFGFNKWYINYAKGKINEIKINNPNADEGQLLAICRRQGGTNLPFAIVILVVYGIIINFINSGI